MQSITFVFFSCGTVMKTIVGLPVLNVYTSEEITKSIAQLPAENNVVDLTLHDAPEKRSY